jgi:NTP pyrophosphatase (non-canonical NTP hydrolase)
MTLNYYRDATGTMCNRKGWNTSNVNTVWLLLTEEVGELASAIRQHQKVYRKSGMRKDRGIDVKMEMGDVFSYLFQLAGMLNIDMDDMWERHQKKIIHRKYSNDIQ